MSNKSNTVVVAAYSDLAAAEADWIALGELAKAGLRVADSALVGKDGAGNPEILERQSHHGWGKGMIAGAVVGLLFPPSLIAGAVVGGIAGGSVAKLNRALGRGKVLLLGEVLDRGEIALIAVIDTLSILTLEKALERALEVHSEDTGLSDEDLGHDATV